MPWRLSVPRVPSLLFLPAAVNNSTKPDSIFFDSNLKFDVKNLLKFVLHNSRNPRTLSQFLLENFITPSSLGLQTEANRVALNLRFYLIKLVRAKLDELEMEVNRISRRISTVRQSFDDSELVREVHSYLNGTLDKHIAEVSTLKGFLSSFRASK
jgi:hypothetical protein